MCDVFCLREVRAVSPFATNFDFNHGASRQLHTRVEWEHRTSILPDFIYHLIQHQSIISRHFTPMLVNNLMSNKNCISSVISDE